MTASCAETKVSNTTATTLALMLLGSIGQAADAAVPRNVVPAYTIQQKVHADEELAQVIAKGLDQGNAMLGTINDFISGWVDGEEVYRQNAASYLSVFKMIAEGTGVAIHQYRGIAPVMDQLIRVTCRIQNKADTAVRLIMQHLETGKVKESAADIQSLNALITHTTDKTFKYFG